MDHLSAILIDSQNLSNVPLEDQTRELIEVAVRDDGLTLCFANKKLCDSAIYIIAVEQNPNAIEFVPAEMQTNEVCIRAILKDINVIRFVINQKKELVYEVARLDLNNITKAYVKPELHYLYRNRMAVAWAPKGKTHTKKT